MPNSLKATWSVKAGLFPGDSFFTDLWKTWEYTSADYESDRASYLEQKAKDPQTTNGMPLFKARQKEATDYWTALNDPSTNNWAELTFIWW
jgi:hypothetical protein